ncbi:MAG: hypothetical protein IJS37_01130, partial [Bacilli bacterium]|nr:hypothetical protein [Bacilli bacterium]
MKHVETTLVGCLCPNHRQGCSKNAEIVLKVSKAHIVGLFPAKIPSKTKGMRDKNIPQRKAARGGLR